MKGVVRSVGVWLYFGMSLCNCITRLISGLLAQQKWMPKLALPCIYSVLGGIALCLFPFATNIAEFAILACMFGVSFGGWFSLLSITTFHIIGETDFSVAIGMILTLNGMSTLAAGPISGKIFYVTCLT